MANLALIYPEITSEAFDKIHSIRKQYDPKYFSVVDPHITLVFGTDKISAEQLAEHVRIKVKNVKPFRLKFDSAKTVENDSKEFFHAFLIPSDGYDEINHLHDILYTDVLESELRHDIPFIPHLGIGTGSKHEMEELVSQLNRAKISIEGTAKEITIVQYDDTKVSNYSPVSLS